MIQYLSNFLTNFNIIDLIYLIATIIENYLVITVLLLIFDVKSSNKQKALYILLIITISDITANLMPSPFNVIINYICMLIFITLIFKMNILKSFTSLVITVFIFGLLNTLIQNPYLTVCNVSLDTFLNTPKYRIPYLAIVYVSAFCLVLLLRKFNKIKLKLTLLDTLDKKTTFILTSNLLLGITILFVQLILTDYYLDIIPIMISILNFILLVAFLSLSIHSFSHILELASTRKNLKYAEECNKSLQILYDKVSGFKHDFENIMFYISGYIDTNDMDGLKKYFEDVKNDYKIAENLSIINPHVIKNPCLYSLLNNKLFQANNLGISFDIEFALNLNNLNVNVYLFSRILGVLIDNAIEASEKCDSKVIKLSFIREDFNNRSIISIKNTYIDNNIDINKIFKKRFSEKEKHSGIGLWETNNFIKKSENLELKTTKDGTFFKQDLFIYD